MICCAMSTFNRLFSRSQWHRVMPGRIKSQFFRSELCAHKLFARRFSAMKAVVHSVSRKKLHPLSLTHWYCRFPMPSVNPIIIPTYRRSQLRSTIFHHRFGPSLLPKRYAMSEAFNARFPQHSLERKLLYLYAIGSTCMCTCCIVLFLYVSSLVMYTCVIIMCLLTLCLLQV